MIEQKLQQLGIRIYMNTVTSVFAIIPDIKQILEENERMSFYREALFNNLDHSDDLIFLSVGEEHIHRVTTAMSELGVLYTVVRTEGLKNARFVENDIGLAAKARKQIQSMQERYTIVAHGDACQPVMNHQIEILKAKNKAEDAQQNWHGELRTAIMEAAKPGVSQIDAALAGAFKKELDEAARKEKAKKEALKKDLEENLNKKSSKMEPDQSQEFLQEELEEDLEPELERTRELTNAKKAVAKQHTEETPVESEVDESFIPDEPSGNDKKKKRNPRKRRYTRPHTSPYVRSTSYNTNELPKEPSVQPDHVEIRTQPAVSQSAFSDEKTNEFKQSESRRQEEERRSALDEARKQEKRIQDVVRSEIPEKNVSSQDASRMGSMSSERNLAHDSVNINRAESLKQDEAEREKRERTAQVYRPAGREENTYLKKTEDVSSGYTNIRERYPETTVQNEINGTASGQERRTEYKKPVENPYRSNEKRATESHNYVNPRDDFGQSNPYHAHHSEKKLYEYNRVQMDESSKAYLNDKKKTDSEGSPSYHEISGGFSPEMDHGGGPYKILYSTHDTEPANNLSAGAEIAKRAAQRDAGLLLHTTKKLIREAAEGGETDGGRELEKLAGNSAPMRRYIKAETELMRVSSIASNTQFQMDAYIKSVSVTQKISERDAKKLIEESFRNNGITSTNIRDTENAIRGTYKKISDLAGMKENELASYLKHAQIPENIKERIGFYRNTGELDKKADVINGMILNAKNRILRSNDELSNLMDLERDIRGLLLQAKNMEELTSVLNGKGIDKSLIEQIQKLDFNGIKNDPSAILDLIRGKMNESQMDGVTLNALDELRDKLKRQQAMSFGDTLFRMDNRDFYQYMLRLGLSNDTVQALNRIGIREIFRDPKVLNRIMAAATEADRVILQNIQATINVRQTRSGSVKRLGISIGRRILQTIWRGTPGGDAMWEMIGYISSVRFLYKTSIKLSIRAASRMLGADHAVVTTLRIAEKPIAAAIGAAAKTGVAQAAATSRFGSAVIQSMKTARRIANTPRKFVEGLKITRAAASGMQFILLKISSRIQTISSVATGALGGATAGGTLAGGAVAAGGAAGGAAAGGAAAAGSILAAPATIAVIVGLTVILLFSCSMKDDKNTELANYQYTQFDPDFQQDILNELQNLNDGFQEQVNQAATNRSFWANATGFSETDSVTFYEGGAYSVHYRDDQGNELDHLNIDNSKEILSMASNYCKYAGWRKPADNATEDEKLRYEQIKRYYLDYCKFLWVSTHRIDIEEYRPGDQTHASEDQSGLTTDSAGKCPKNGTRVWLQADFTRQDAGNNVICGISNEYTAAAGEPSWGCSEVPGDPQFYNYGENALCTHPMENREHNGWKRVVENGEYVTATHYNCPYENGHMCDACSTHDDDGCDHVYHKCGEICPSTGSVFVGSNAHKHTCYLWEYECGGHMGAVIYITVGSVNRLKDMGPANDFDYSTVNEYPDEETTSADTENSQENAGE